MGHHFHIRFDASDKIGPSWPQLVHEFSQLLLEFVAHTDEGQFAFLAFRLGPTDKKVTDELVLALMSQGF